MRRLAPMLFAALFAASGSWAQTQTPAPTEGGGNLPPQHMRESTGSSSTPRPATGGGGQTAASVNRFTEAEARSHIEAAGYTNVTNLARDNLGQWRAEATHNGRRASVILDGQGHIAAQQQQ